jgi:DNA modification methylase
MSTPDTTQIVICGDNIESLKKYPDNHFDSVVTDAPYGLGKEPDPVKMLQAWLDHGYLEVTGGGFMNKKWDAFVPQPVFWREVFRVLKPGGHVLCFFGTRTYDWGVMAMRLAGFEIRDCIQYMFDNSEFTEAFIESLSEDQKQMLSQILKNGDNSVSWCYGSGFPKSLDISKQLDKQAGAEREVVGIAIGKGGENINKISREGGNDNGDAKGCGAYGKGAKQVNIEIPVTKPSTEEAKHYSGWGSALKPAQEPIVLARKPLSENTIAENVLKHGTGGINIDGCRIETSEKLQGGAGGLLSHVRYEKEYADENDWKQNNGGRWPANIILDDEAGRMLDRQSGITGGASQFFYCAKASKSERNKGLQDLLMNGDKRKTPMAGRGQGGLKCKNCNKWKNSGNPCKCEKPDFEEQKFNSTPNQNTHPTVKPISLARYLVRLITPKGGKCLDPFGGSGTTGIACKLEGVNCVLLDIEDDYCKIAEARIAAWESEPEEPKQPSLFD